MCRISTITVCIVFFISINIHSQTSIGSTEITKWQYGKTGAISITYDDATINQFRKALPIMDTLEFKATFFINTSVIPGSRFPPKWIGRPLELIVTETATVPTNKENLFERAGALRFLEIENAVERHNSSGALFESNNLLESYNVVDKAFEEARKKNATREKKPVLLSGDRITWKEIKAFASNGHEFGSHTISHPRLAVLDEPNMLYELEKCKEEIREQLGVEHTFSAECPFGTENERVMKYAYKVHPALRNRMPESFLEELNRGSRKSPLESKKEYIQWQRGPLTKTPMTLMKSWVDTLLMVDNIWLVLTFHGVDGIGWEAKPSTEHEEYFRYMKEKEDKLWVATFKDVTKYMRERMNAKLKVDKQKTRIRITLQHTLDKSKYNLPLTLKTYVDPSWNVVTIKQGNRSVPAQPLQDSRGSYVLYQALPNLQPIELVKGN
jgi:peptidoglycan/xylan/chitin deacetylase (PgdA/CDA1 family)